MIRNSHEAVERLHHKRTGELLPRKVLDRTTNNGRQSRLVYVDDSLVFLRFIDTNVATFTPTGVVLHTEGWYTQATWRCIDTFTPARTYQANGLRFVSTGWGWDTLYVPGLELTNEGEAVNPLARPLVKAITNRVSNFRRKAKRYAAHVVRDFDRYHITLTGCELCRHGMWSSPTFAAHMADHVEMGDRIWNTAFDEQFESTRALRPELLGDALCAAVAQRIADRLVAHTFPEAVKAIAPDTFEYPQIRR